MMMMNKYQVLGGEEIEHNEDTGAMRGTDEGKTRPDLIGVHARRRLGEHLRKGAEKYGPRNWEKGQSISRYMASLHRHILQWEEGCESEDHLAAILFNVMGIIHVQEQIALGLLSSDLDDYHRWTEPEREKQRELLKRKEDVRKDGEFSDYFNREIQRIGQEIGQQMFNRSIFHHE